MLNDKISILENNLNEELNYIRNKDISSSDKKQDKNRQGRDILKTSNYDIDKVKNDLNIKIKEIEQKINDIKNDYSTNKVNNDNLNIKTFTEKINNIENNLGNKIKNIEIKLKNLESKKGDKDKKNLLNKITNLENLSKNFEHKIINLEKNSQNLTPDEDILEKINNLEELINQIKDKKKKSEIHLKKSIEEINNNDLINKVNNLINWTKTYENEFQNMEAEIKNNDNYLNILERRIKKLENKSSNILKQSNEIKIDKSKNDTLYNVISNTIDSNEDSKSLNTSKNSNLNSNTKKTKKKKNHQKNKDSEKRGKTEIRTKNYGVIKNLDDTDESNQYLSQSYNKGGVINSHSVNRFELKKDNYLEKNSIEYQIVTRRRSKSKDHKRNKQQEIFYDNQTSKSNKYRNTNPRIQREYENSITESRIVEYDDITFIENKLKEIYPNYNIDFNLVYRATDDGDRAMDFHKKCDKIGPNITFVKTKKDYVFGGFTVKNWEHLKRDINEKKPNLGSASRDARAFGFCVNNQRIYKNERPDEFAIWCNRNFGATFKNNFFQIFDNCFKKGGYCSKKDNSHFGGQEYDYEISGGESKFAIDDIEVYEILFQ